MCGTSKLCRSSALSFILLAILAYVAAPCAGATGEPNDPDFTDIASCPDPSDGAVGVVAPLLRWTAGDDALLHRVYFGTDPEPGPEELVNPGQHSALYYHAPGLAPATMYYWRVDEIWADGTEHVGDVWTFTSAPMTAWAPFPRSGDKWIETDAPLTWHPGLYAVLHDVYFGMDADAIVNRGVSLFQGSQTDCTFAPASPLVPETTYYWAVDEIDAAGTTHDGAIWSFTTIGPGGGVKVEYFDRPYPNGAPIATRIEEAIDRRWDDDVVPDGARSARWTADLEVAVADTYTFIATHDGGVQLWLDGAEIIDRWAGQTTADSCSDPQELEPGFYGLHMVCYEGPTVARLSWQIPGLARQVIPAGPLQPPMRAREPQPYRGAIDVLQDITLRWSAGDTAAWHEVYFGDDKAAVADATTASAGIYRGRQALDETSYAPGVLEWNKTYYWRVDEVNEADRNSPWKGSVWSFTTADFLVVDDFERYGEESPYRIFQTWIDGWGYTEPPPGHPGNGTGATVGCVWPMDRWCDVAHEGKQSMPFEYNNVDPPYYSEAYRTWDMPQDWTIDGVSDLSLWVMGQPISFLERPDGAVVVSGRNGGDGTDDAYGFASKELDGDGEIIARIESLSNAEGWARAGVMMRDTLDSGSLHVAVNDRADLYVALEDSTAGIGVAVHPDPAVVNVTEWTQWKIPLSQFSSANVDLTLIRRIYIGVGDRDDPQRNGTGRIWIDDIRLARPTP